MQCGGAQSRERASKCPKIMERNDKMVAVQKEPEQKRNGADQNILIDMQRFLAVISIVINCAVGMQGNME